MPSITTPSSSTTSTSRTPRLQVPVPVQEPETEHKPEPEQLLPLLTEPWDIVDQYIEWHSQETLVREQQQHYNTTSTSTNHHRRRPNRSYAMAFYSCPFQLGNRMHHFLNAFLWSILTNRTMLWQYWDTKTCRNHDYGGKHYDSRICRAANRVHDCQGKFLLRQSWIPSYQDYYNNKNHTNTTWTMTPQQLNYWATHSQFATPGRGVGPYDPDNQNDPTIRDQRGIIDAPHQHERYPLVVFPTMLGQSHALANPDIREELLVTHWARQTAAHLYQYGATVLYGILFHAAFDVAPDLVAHTTAIVVPNHNNKENHHHNDSAAATTTINDSKDNDHNADDHDDNTDTYTNTDTDDLEFSHHCSIAVHSRHANASLSGINITQEIDCIQSLWEQYYMGYYTNTNHNDNNYNTNNNNDSGESSFFVECDLFIMTDRPLTLKHLVEWCQEQPPKVKMTTSATTTTHNDSATTTADADDGVIVPFPCRRAIYASHEKGTSFVAEHGPYAGAGFLQDLTVVRQSALTSIGVVGGKRSSTDLLLQWMEYDRMAMATTDYDDDDKNDDGTTTSTTSDDDFSKNNNNQPKNSATFARRGRQQRRRKLVEATRPFPELPKCMLPTV